MRALLYLSIFICFSCHAQVPESPLLLLKTYGGNRIDKISPNVTRTYDGGFIVSMVSNSENGSITDTFCHSPASNRTIFLKYNADATVREWDKCYKGDRSDTCYMYMLQTNDHKYVVAGTVLNNSKWIIRKEDESGNLIWLKTYTLTNNQGLSSIIATDDGGYILFGTAYWNVDDTASHYGGMFTTDFWVLKLDESGNKLWSKIIGGSDFEYPGSVVAAPAGGCYIVGATSSNDHDCTGSHGGDDLYVARLDLNGNILWHKMLGGSEDDIGLLNPGGFAVADGSGGIFITTASNSEDGDVHHHITHGQKNIWTMHMNSDGNLLWNTCYGGGGPEYPYSMCLATDGSIWITGISRNQGGQVNNAYGSTDALVIHADNSGNFLSSRVLGSDGQDGGNMIYPLNYGYVICGGYYGTSNGTFASYPVSGSYSVSDVYLAIFGSWTADISGPEFSNYHVKLYPNPANDILHIETSSTNESTVIINDITGRIMYRGRFTGTDQIDVSGWAKGIYYVQVKGSSGGREMGKVEVR